MRIRLVRRSTAGLLSLALINIACGPAQPVASSATAGSSAAASAPAPSVAAEPGISSDKVRIGATFPMSGNFAVVGEIGSGARAYFDYVNKEKGGVNGRTIEYLIKDDAGDPARGLELTRQLVEGDQVFAIVGTANTAVNGAIYDYLNQQKVPHIFLPSGARTWAADVKGHPWTAGFAPSYLGEAYMYGAYVRTNYPTEKIAILWWNSDVGKDYLEGFKQGLASTQQIVADASYATTDSTVDTQMSQLQRSGATVLYLAGAGKQMSLAIKYAYEHGWKTKLTLLSQAAQGVQGYLTPAGLDASTGLVSAFYFKDPSDAVWNSDQGVTEYKRIIAKYGNGVDPNEPNTMLGASLANAFVEALSATKTLNRSELVTKTRAMSNLQLPLLIPGVTLDLQPGRCSPITGYQLGRFDGRGWRLAGSVIPVKC